MAHGKPVIATAWSGNMDFMTVSNSFPVQFGFVEVEENVGPYQAGQRWVEPSIEHAAERMREVFEHREQAVNVGLRAKEDIDTEFSESQVGRLIRERLQAINLRQQMTVFQRREKESFSRYLLLVGRLRAAISAAIPRSATVAVISKGDTGLLQLDCEKAWHFPRREDGAYTGYHPASSAAAIEHLEAQRALGVGFLIIPESALWWLEHYREFADHLATRYQKVVHDEACLVFDLRGC
jgi:hypothetical protein